MDLYKKYDSGQYQAVITDIVKDLPDAQNFKWKELLKDHNLKAKDAKHSFSSVEEYKATIAMGAKIVQNITEYEQGFFFSHTRIRILKQKDHGLIAVVELPEFHREAIKSRQAATISPGDRGFLCLQYYMNGDGEDSRSAEVEVRFYMEFIEPFPGSPPGVLAAKLKPRQKRPRKSDDDQSLGKDEHKPDLRITPARNDLHDSLTNKKTMAFVLESIPQIKVPESLKGPDSIMNYILKQTSIKGEVDTVVRHSEFVYVYKALTRIDEELAEYLAGVSKFQVPRLDIYSPLDDKALVDSDCMQLNKSQRAALELGRSAPAGFVIAHGGPGTGKTHFVVQVTKPFFLDKKTHKVLVTSAGNRGADSIALELNKWLQTLDPSIRDDSYIVRLHSVKTETNIFLKDAEDAKREALSEMAKQPTHTSQQTAEPKLKGDAIYNHYRTYACGRFKGVDDERVQHISLSVGMIMKQRLSTKPWLQKLYSQYGRGEIFEDDDVQSFIGEVHDFMQEIIGGATAVCATVSGVADKLVRESYSACELIVVDEAARVPEYQWWPLLGFYKQAVGKIMVGDPFQMEPAAGHDEEKSPLREQMALSLQARLQQRGFPSGFFDTQYRAVPEIADIYNNTRYEGRLKSGEEAQVERRPLAQAIIQHNKDEYGVAHSVVFLDVTGANEENEKKKKNKKDDKGRPKFCNEYIVAVTNILEGLINAGFGSDVHPATIAVLTPYQLEYKRLKYVRTKMSDDYPQAEDIVIETVDKVQGMEYDIVIIDPVVTCKVGYLDFRRLNVLFSRARSGLYVLGCTEKWGEMFRSVDTSTDRAYPLKQFAQQLKRYTKLFPEVPGETCPSKNDYYDPGEFEQVPGKSRTPVDIRKVMLAIILLVIQEQMIRKKVSEEIQKQEGCLG